MVIDFQRYQTSTLGTWILGDGADFNKRERGTSKQI
jgi:hypothetical protein